MQIENKNIIITGAADGIGKQIVLQLLEKKASVAAIDINEKKLDDLKNETGKYHKNISFHVCDISNREQMSSLKKDILDFHRNIDGIINVAGIIQPFIKVNELKYDEIDRVISVNLYGTIHIVKTFLPNLLKNNSKTCIVNVSSMGAFLPVPGQSVYGASKAAVKLFTEGLYAELLDTNTRVTLVLPGAVNTNISMNSNVEIDDNLVDNKKYKMISAQNAAKIIIKGMEKEKFKVLVGSDSKFMDKFYRIAPKNAVKFISKKMADLL